MIQVKQPQSILFCQHGMADTNKPMTKLANILASSDVHVLVPDLGYFNTLVQIKPLIQKVEKLAEETFEKYSNIPTRIVAHSLGGLIWVEILSHHRQWWDRIESLVLLGCPIGGADLARIVDPFGWGVGIAKDLGKNRRFLAEKIAAVIPTLVVAGNSTGGGDGTIPLESTKLKHAHFVCLDGVSHPQLRDDHPDVVKTIQEFWSQPRQPLPASEDSLISDLIFYFRRLPGITDASERDFSKAETVLSFSDGTTIRTWTNMVGVLHVFIGNPQNKCQYAGFVGWIHTAGLQDAIESLKNCVVD